MKQTVKQYFATLPTKELIKECSKRIGVFNRFIEREGWAEIWDRSEDLYFGRHMGEGGVRNSRVVDHGDQGELKGITVNHYRNLIQHTLALTCSQKPAYDPRAKNSDLESIQQTRIASNVIDSYVVEKRMGRHMYSAAERSLVYAKGYVYMTWDPSLGRPHAVQEMLGADGEPIEKIVYEGDVTIAAKSPRHVIYDVRLKDWEKKKWVTVRTYENKWDLAARHPDKADDIINLSPEDCYDVDSSRMKGNHDEDSENDDLIPVYHFYHLKTDAVPSGRYLKFLNAEIDLYDGAMPYQRLPVFRILPGEVFDSSEGYSNAFDTMQLQEVCDVLYSIPYTNQQAFGTQLIHLPQGCEFSPSMFKGLAFLRGGAPGTEPKGIQLTQSPPEIFKNIEFIEGAMTKLMGLNSAVTSDPTSNLKSGEAIARVQAMAIQFASNFQKSWAELQEDCGTFLLELLQDFAKTERMVAMAGKHNKGAMTSFTGDSLKMIDRVAVDLGNPMTRTVAGRMEFATMLYDRGEINGRQFIEVASTGQLDAQLEGKTSQIELIRKENEDLLAGKPVQAIVGDLHLTHSAEHMTVINDPHLRSLAAQGDQQAIAIVGAVTAHIQQHEMLHATQTPFFGMISGEPPPPPPPMLMPPPPGGDQGPPLDQGGEPAANQMPNPADPSAQMSGPLPIQPLPAEIG